MNLHWLATAVSLGVAYMAWRRARRADERIAQLTHMIWELKYQYGELRQSVTSPAAAAAEVAPMAPAGPASDSFVPLSSLKR